MTILFLMVNLFGSGALLIISAQGQHSHPSPLQPRMVTVVIGPDVDTRPFLAKRPLCLSDDTPIKIAHEPSIIFGPSSRRRVAQSDRDGDSTTVIPPPI